MYTSMCVRDLREFKKGEFFDAYQNNTPYVYIRPELTEKEFVKVPKSDYFNNFMYFSDSYLFEARIYKPDRKILGLFTLRQGDDIPITGTYYDFSDLNHDVLKALHSKILFQLEGFEKYLVDQLCYEEIKSSLDRVAQVLNAPGRNDATETKLLIEFIDGYGRVLQRFIKAAKKSMYRRQEQ